jgi:hypothetical protein
VISRSFASAPFAATPSSRARYNHRMPRVRRLLHNFAAGASALLGVAAVVLWARSYATHESLSRDGPALVGLDSTQGQVTLSYMDRTVAVWPTYQFRGWFYAPAQSVARIPRNVQRDAKLNLDALGFGVVYAHRPPPDRNWVQPAGNPVALAARVPYWFLTALCAILPARAFLYRAGAPAGPRNRCRVCGYDLRATPDRCPECGAVPV